MLNRDVINGRIVSQRSLHDAPIFRLLLKVAVDGMYQCDCLKFLGSFDSNITEIDNAALLC